jgi:hypothetical protein
MTDLTSPTQPATLRDRVAAMKLRADMHRQAAVTPMSPAYEMIRDLADVVLALLPVSVPNDGEERDDERETVEGEAHFARWFTQNYPPDTIIARPEWHAPRILRAALHAVSRPVAGGDQQ